MLRPAELAEFWHSEEVRAELGNPGFTVDDDTQVLTQRFRLVSLEEADDTRSESSAPRP